MNLCTNAFHAMEDTGGKLDISLKEVTLSNEDLVHKPDIETNTFVQLSVSDSGAGIAPGILEKIFRNKRICFEASYEKEYRQSDSQGTG